jgi:DNA-binding CsgD family transcriptional regulator
MPAQMPSTGTEEIVADPTLPLAQFSESVALIYDAAADAGHWGQALDALRNIFAARTAIAIVRPDTAKSKGISIILHDEVYETSDLLTQYLQVPHCPFGSIAPRQVASISDLMSDDAWENSPFFKEICAPDGVYDVLCLEICLEDRSVYRLRFTRGAAAPRFGEAEKALAALFVPHLARAFAMNRATAGEGVIHDRYAEACNRVGIAMFVTDRDGRLLHSSGFAARLLEEGDALKLAGDRLIAAHEASNKAFQQMIRNTLRGDAFEPEDVMPLLRCSGRDSLFVYMQRVSDAEGLHAGRRRPALTIFMRDPGFRVPDAEQMVQRLFHLTQTEATLMMHLANGMSLLEAAETMRVRHNTARAHLRAIFEKTGLQRQSSLVRLVLNGVAPMGHADTPHLN